MASRRKTGGPFQSNGNGTQDDVGELGVWRRTKRHSEKRASSVRIGYFSEKQTAERDDEGGKKQTHARRKTKNLVSKLYRVHEPKPNLGPTGIQMNSHPWANRHRRKGFTTDAARCSKMH